jgi:hypothetical protein
LKASIVRIGAGGRERRGALGDELGVAHGLVEGLAVADAVVDRLAQIASVSASLRWPISSASSVRAWSSDLAAIFSIFST